MEDLISDQEKCSELENELIVKKQKIFTRDNIEREWQNRISEWEKTELGNSYAGKTSKSNFISIICSGKYNKIIY